MFVQDKKRLYLLLYTIFNVLKILNLPHFLIFLVCFVPMFHPTPFETFKEGFHMVEHASEDQLWE